MKKRRLFLATAALLCSTAIFAQKQCDLSISVTVATGYNTTLNYLDSCMFDLKITNNGNAALANTDTLWIGIKGLTSASPLIPTGPVATGQSISLPKALKVKHTIDTLKAEDINLDLCYILLKQANIQIGTPPRPATVTYLDNVAANDTSCNKVTLKKRPLNSILEWGSGNNETLALYPNPAVDEVKFDMKPDRAENVLVSVKDLTGREVASKDYGKLPVGVNTTLSIDLRQLKAGLYFVEWSSGERRATGKLNIRR